MTHEFLTEIMAHEFVKQIMTHEFLIQIIAQQLPSELRFIIIDCCSINYIDTTGVTTLRQVFT